MTNGYDENSVYKLKARPRGSIIGGRPSLGLLSPSNASANPFVFGQSPAKTSESPAKVNSVSVD